MQTRRSARVRAANALRTSTTVNEAQDENNPEQSREEGAGGKSAATGKENARLRNGRSRTKTPLQDVTNNARTTRSRRSIKTVDKPPKPNDDEREVVKDAGTSSVKDKRSTRRKNQRPKPTIVGNDGFPAAEPALETEHVDVDTSSAQNIQPDATGSLPNSRPNSEAEALSPSKEKRPKHDDIETELETRSSNPLTDEIQPNPQPMDALAEDEIQPNPQPTDPREEDHESEPYVDEIQPNSPAKKRRMPSPLPQTSDEIELGPARNETPSADLLAGSGVRPSSPMVHDSPPLSPLATRLPSEMHQTSWMAGNRESNSADLDTTKPRQAVYTYGKRRRMARVSLPTMQALGVRAKSPSSESQGGSENDGDDNLSDASAESEDESGKSPKRNPKLQAFVKEQKKLWQEVDEIDLLVESD